MRKKILLGAGIVAGITAPRHRGDVRAMVQYYPAYCIPDDAQKRFASAAEIPETYKVFHRRVSPFAEVLPVKQTKQRKMIELCERTFCPDRGRPM